MIGATTLGSLTDPCFVRLYFLLLFCSLPFIHIYFHYNYFYLKIQSSSYSVQFLSLGQLIPCVVCCVLCVVCSSLLVTREGMKLRVIKGHFSHYRYTGFDDVFIKRGLLLLTYYTIVLFMLISYATLREPGNEQSLPLNNGLSGR